MARSQYNDHPLRTLFRLRRFTPAEGMNWLQDRRHISDLCIVPEDVSAVDTTRVLTLAGLSLLDHPWRPSPPRVTAHNPPA